MVLTKFRKPPRSKCISLRGRSIRVVYERVSHTFASHNSVAGTSHNVPLADNHTVPVQEGMPTSSDHDEGNKEIEDPCAQLTTYHKQKSKRVENWTAIQDKLLNIGIEVTFIPPSHTCISCGQTVDHIYRCMDCGTSALYCHSCIGIFHSLKNGTFIHVHVDTPVWIRPDNHTCVSSYHQDIVVIDNKVQDLQIVQFQHPSAMNILAFNLMGRQHKRVMQFCNCELPAETMLRSYMWPSSPKKPVLAFHIGLLEWLTALMLECQVSAKGFCEALKAKHSKHRQGLVESEVNNVYKILMKECLIQYRHFQHRLCHPTHLCEDLAAGAPACPACFQFIIFFV